MRCGVGGLAVIASYSMMWCLCVVWVAVCKCIVYCYSVMGQFVYRLILDIVAVGVRQIPHAGSRAYSLDHAVGLFPFKTKYLLEDKTLVYSLH